MRKPHEKAKKTEIKGLANPGLGRVYIGDAE